MCRINENTKMDEVKKEIYNIISRLESRFALWLFVGNKTIII